MSVRTLRAVERAARRRHDADRAYREAIEAAREDGHTMPAIGSAAGITKQGVYKLLRKRSEDA
jgi:hypothetical protein